MHTLTLAAHSYALLIVHVAQWVTLSCSLIVYAVIKSSEAVSSINHYAVHPMKYLESDVMGSHP